MYTGIRNGVERSPRGETGSSNRMGSTLYLSVIVVSVRVTRISTDGCAVRMQFVVGLHSVPYLFNYISLSLTQEHPAAGCSFLLPFYALTSASTEIWHSGAAPRGSLVPWRSGGTSPPIFSPSFLSEKRLSTGVFHSVENLHVCDSRSLRRGTDVP